MRLAGRLAHRCAPPRAAPLPQPARANPGAASSSRRCARLGALPALLFDGDAAPPSELAVDGDEPAAAAAAAAYAAQQGFDLDARLAPTQRADAAAFRALIQERVAPALVRRPPSCAKNARRQWLSCGRGMFVCLVAQRLTRAGRVCAAVLRLAGA